MSKGVKGSMERGFHGDYIIDIYNEILRGERVSFPMGTWTKADSPQVIAKLVKYLFVDILNMSRDDICSCDVGKILIEYKLGAVLKHHNNLDILNLAFNDTFKPWKIRNVPNRHMDEDIIKGAVKWVVETKLGNKSSRVVKYYNVELLKSCGLRFVIKYGLYKSIELAYPGVFKPWEFSSVPHGYWTRENIVTAVKWLVNKLELSREDICEQYTVYLLRSNNLHFYTTVTVYESLNMAFPNEYKPWELSNVSRNYWNDATVGEAIRHLIECKLKLTRSEVCMQYSRKLLIDNRLGSIATLGLYRTLDLAFPGEFKKEDLIAYNRGFKASGCAL